MVLTIVVINAQIFSLALVHFRRTIENTRERCCRSTQRKISSTLTPLLPSSSHQPSILNRQRPRILRFQALFTKKTRNPSLHRLHPILLALTINPDRIVCKTLQSYCWQDNLHLALSSLESSITCRIRYLFLTQASLLTSNQSLLAIGIALSIALSSKHCCCLQASSSIWTNWSEKRRNLTPGNTFCRLCSLRIRSCIKHHVQHQVSLFDPSSSPHIKESLLSPSITLISKHSSRLEA